MNILLANLLTNFPAIKKIFAGIIILLIVLAPFVLLYSNMSDLRKDNKLLSDQMVQLKAENAVLKGNIETLKKNVETLNGTNDSNVKTIEKLLLERKEAKRIIDRLSQTRLNDQLSIKMMSDRIKEMLREDINNDAAPAPVLKETIRGIQESRKR